MNIWEHTGTNREHWSSPITCSVIVRLEIAYLVAITIFCVSVCVSYVILCQSLAFQLRFVASFAKSLLFAHERVDFSWLLGEIR